VALEIIWIWAVEAELNPEELLLAPNKSGETALHLAAKNNHEEIFQKMCDLAEQAQLNPDELMNKLLQAKVKDGNTAGHRAAIFRCKFNARHTDVFLIILIYDI
jgi:ankyrin repeat protein